MTPVRFTIALQSKPGSGWAAEVRDAHGVTIDGSVRTLSPVPLPDPDDELLTFPACALPLPGGTPDAQALEALDAASLGAWYANMASGQASDGMPRTFGRYLFELVLGTQVWAAITARAAAAPIDLRIACDPADWALMRLPWELMHDGQYFLAARPGPLVLMSREIVAPGAPASPRRFAPRVLFVIGSLVGDTEIRAGAEYLGLLRRLQALDLTLDCRVLREATAERLQAAIADFQPSVVHFICHGGFLEGRGSLRLLPSDQALPFQDYTAPVGIQGRPLVVVLLDEVQRYAGAAGRFVADLLRAGGLGTEQDPIPVAFTYRKDLNYAEPYEQVRKALDAVSNWAIRHELHPLREAATDRSIYLHLLLQRTPPLVPAANLPAGQLDGWLGIIHNATDRGYPSQLKSTAPALKIALMACQLANVIVEADDERVLAGLGK